MNVQVTSNKDEEINLPTGIDATNELLAMIYYRLTQITIILAEDESSDTKVTVMEEIKKEGGLD